MDYFTKLKSLAGFLNHQQHDEYDDFGIDSPFKKIAREGLQKKNSAWSRGTGWTQDVTDNP